jgi:transposase
MAKGYRPVRRDQPFLLPPDMREWLPADHVVWLVIKAVGQLDTSAAHAHRRTGGAGTAGYDPDMLLVLLIWAYANKVTSSRRIEALCRTDVSFRVICAGDVPDHVTIARFRQRFPELAEQLFTQVLVLCAQLGMGQLGVVALDGTKIGAAASKDANRAEKALRKLAADLAAAHAETDAAEDDLFGAGRRGDEVPAEFADPATRDERIRAALAGLEAERKAADQASEAEAEAYLADARAGRPRRGHVPAAAAETAARERLAHAEADAAARVARREQRDAEAAAAGRAGYGGKRPVPPDQSAKVRKARAALEAATTRAPGGGRPREPATGKKGPGPVRNITDPDSRLMPVRGGGFIQGYNAQNLASSDGLIIGTELTADTTDTGWFEPMLRLGEDAAALISAHRPGGGPGQIGLLLADAGYCSAANLTAAGPDRLIATGTRRDLERQARTGHDPGRGGPIGAMTARLATPEGITAYRQRGPLAETPHGQIKHNLGFRRLSMRGKNKAAAEWRFACTVHNLLKAITTGHLTPQTLTTLA